MPRALIAGEKERAVLAVIDFGQVNRSSGGGAELVEVPIGWLPAIEIVQRAKRFGAVEFEQSPVKIVGAAFDKDVDGAAGRVGELRRGDFGGDLEFGHRIDRRGDRFAVVVRRLRGGAVEVERGPLGALAVHADRRQIAVPTGRFDAGREISKRVHPALPDRSVDHHDIRHHGPGRRGFRFQQ